MPFLPHLGSLMMHPVSSVLIILLFLTGTVSPRIQESEMPSSATAPEASHMSEHTAPTDDEASESEALEPAGNDSDDAQPVADTPEADAPADDRPASDDQEPPAEPETAPRIALDTFAQAAGLSRIAGPHEEYRLTGDGRTAVFYIDSRRLLLDDTLVWLNGGTARTNGQWHISATDVLTILLPWVNPTAVLADRGATRVLLDAGHGGRDPGAVAGGFLEKDVVLDITQRVATRLRDAGETVLMTRTNDVALTLEERTDIARQERADLFVSIHANQASVLQARGIESFVLPAKGYPPTTSNRPDRGDYAGNAHDAASTLLAKYVHRGMLRATGAPDRGVKRSRYVVLREAPGPAVLVECGFLSNPTEARLLATDAYRDKLADGIAAGLQRYLAAVRAAHEADAEGVGVPQSLGASL